MKFNKLTIQNFLGIGYIEIEFDYNGLVLITGENRDSPVSTSNGASKSSIAEAILWCLYGVTKRGLKGDDVVNRSVGADCYVELVFDSYCVCRSRLFSGGNNLRVFQDGVEITKGTTQATQELIEQIVGRGRLAFEKLFHFGQGDTQPLASMTDANLKTIFEESFGLGFIKDCFMKIKVEEKKKEGELIKLNNELAIIESAIVQHDEQMRIIVEIHRHFAEQQKEAIEGLQKDISSLIDEKAVYEELLKSDDAHNLNKTVLEEIRVEVSDDISIAKKLLEEANKLVSDANARYQMAIREGEAYRDQLVRLYDEKKNAELKIGTPCPSCKKTINSEDVHGVVQSCEEKIALESEKITIYRDMLSEADKNLKEQKAVLAKATENLNNAISKNEEQSITWKRFAELENAALRVREIEGRISEIKGRIEKASSEANPMPDKIKMAAKDGAHKRLHKKKLSEDLKQEMGDYDLLLTLGEIFGNSGLKNYIFDSITPRLNELVNLYLQRLDNISVEFSTQKQLKSGDLREKFDIVIHTVHGPCSFESLSGGERQRVSLAISLAMNKLMREMAGDPFNVLFLDEVTEALDESSSEAVFNLLSDFVDDVDNVFIISHNQALKDIVPNVLTIVKEGGVARLAHFSS